MLSNNIPPAIGGPVRVANDITKNRNPSREPMTLGGEICAVHAGNSPIKTPTKDCGIHPGSHGQFVFSLKSSGKGLRVLTFVERCVGCLFTAWRRASLS